ncbi:MAG: histidine triad nucleotide-binding protein [Ignavibacteriaceae bacterium]
MGKTIFSKIISKEIPADILYESETVMAFRDIKPQAPVHVLIIPKEEISAVSELKRFEHAGLLGEMFDAANIIAKKMALDKEGFRLVFNNGRNGGQEVNHLHMHLLGGRQMKWPPG